MKHQRRRSAWQEWLHRDAVPLYRDWKAHNLLADDAWHRWLSEEAPAAYHRR